MGKGMGKGSVNVEDTEPLSPQPTTPQPTTPPTMPQPTSQQVEINRLLIQKVKQQQLRIDDQQKQIDHLAGQVTWMLATLDRVMPLETSSEH